MNVFKLFFFQQKGKTIENFDSKYNRLNIESVDSSSDEEEGGEEEVKETEKAGEERGDNADESKETEMDQDVQKEAESNE